MSKKLKIFLFVICLFPVIGHGQPEFAFQLYGGSSSHLTTSVKINYSEYFYHLDDVTFFSESFVSPQYYGFQVSFMVDRENLPLRVGLEFIHDKAYVYRDAAVMLTASNDPARQTGQKYPFNRFLDDFAMSHGFNYLLLKIGYPVWEILVWKHELRIFTSLGAGLVYPHIESWRNSVLLEQYEWHGPAFAVDVMAEFSLTWHFVGLLGAKFTTGWVHDAKIVDGTIATQISSWQVILGLGVRIH